MTRLVYDFSECHDFFDKCIKAGNGGMKKDFALWLEGLGIEFLEVVQELIKSRKIIDTRLLLHSFNKGNANNIWEISRGDLTLQVGTNVNYAEYVNYGHWLNPLDYDTFYAGSIGPQSVSTRFVPGVWKKRANGKPTFEYQPGAKTGMVLKQKYIEGKHFWEDSIKILEKIMPDFIEAKLEQWFNSCFF